MDKDVRKFMTSKYPTDKHIQCPVPERCWSAIQEYADEYHQAKLKNHGVIGDVSGLLPSETQIKEYIGKLFGKIGNKYFDTGATSEDYDKLKERNEYLERKFKSMVSSSNVIETFESKMKVIDNKAIFGESITDEEKDFYNENFDRMVENCNDESIHWKHHASKI